MRGYRYDLEQFLRWFSQAKGSASRLEKLSILDLINYRQHLVNVEALKATTVNRRLKALRRFCRWAQQNRLHKSNVALELCGLLAATHGALRVAGVDLAKARAAARERLGYVAQKFSLYGNLSVSDINGQRISAPGSYSLCLFNVGQR